MQQKEKAMDDITAKKLILRVNDMERRLKSLEESILELIWSKEGDKEAQYVAIYGAHVDKSVAAQIIGVTRATIYAMLKDGRIQGACGGKRVDVRSIARYIQDNEGSPKCGRRMKETV